MKELQDKHTQTLKKLKAAFKDEMDKIANESRQLSENNLATRRELVEILKLEPRIIHPVLHVNQKSSGAADTRMISSHNQI